MNRNQALDSAKAAINRARKSYGDPREHFERVARLWNSHLHGTIGVTNGIEVEDVAIMLGLVKIARLEHDPQHADSWCDLAGYAACGAEVSEPKQETVRVASEFVTDGYVPVIQAPGETLYEAMQRTTRELYAPKKEPAWKRAKVGDRIRIREGARSMYDVPLPLVAKVVRIVRDHSDYHTGIDSPRGLYVRNDDVLDILPPLPESKFGFTVGETVNAAGEKPGHNPAVITGFNGDAILLRWPWGESELMWSANELRHGA